MRPKFPPQFLPGILMTALSATPAAAADFPAPAALPDRATPADPLVTLAGTPVKTKAEWENVRRPELRELFQHYMYGRTPAAPTNLTGVVLFEDKTAFGGKGTLAEIEVRFDAFGKSNPLPVRLLIAVPNARPAAGCPVFVGPNFTGNHTFTDDVRVRIPDAWMYPRDKGVVNNKATAAGRGAAKTTWPLEDIIARGHAVATFYNGDIQPDRPAVNEGFRAAAGTDPNDPAGTATVAAWAWGVSRAVDYLITRPDIDAKRIAAVGHSRLGKTVLLATAFDARIAAAFPHQAGCGGTGPSRHADPKAEGVKRINTAFPHWFAGNFTGFNDALPKLPFDQDSLLALCAPRPVLYTNAEQDAWANPAGQFEMMKRATPVYALYGVPGLEAAAMPAVGGFIKSRLGYAYRAGPHDMRPADWDTFTAFADVWLK